MVGDMSQRVMPPHRSVSTDIAGEHLAKIVSEIVPFGLAIVISETRG